MGHSERLINTPYTQFHTLVWGNQGKKVLLLHGFPETPHIFGPLAQKLEQAGFQVFAPFLPGYGPTAPIHHNTSITHLDDLATSLAALSDAICDGDEKLILVGHDWGAVSAYVTAASHPTRFRKLVTMAVPPLPVFLKSFLKQPSQLRRSSYMLFFQLRANLPEKLISANNHKRLRQLCLRWSGDADASREYFSDTECPFEGINSFSHPLGYYRGLFPLLSGSIRKWTQSIKMAFTKIDVPTLILVGELDGCIPAPCYQGYERYFTKPVEFAVLANAGHFLPIDQPHHLASLIAVGEQG